MLPFLSFFGVDTDNGLSPLAVSIYTPSDLIGLLNQFFKAPKQDTRGRTRLDGSTLSETEDEVVNGEGTSVEELGNAAAADDNDEEQENVPSNEHGNTLSAGVLASHVDE